MKTHIDHTHANIVKLKGIKDPNTAETLMTGINADAVLGTNNAEVPGINNKISPNQQSKALTGTASKQKSPVASSSQK